MFADWFRLMGEMTETGLAAQRVIALRMLRLARGGALAQREAYRMTTEKITAAAEANMLLAKGADFRAVTRHYRRAVRANEKRLGGR